MTDILLTLLRSLSSIVKTRALYKSTSLPPSPSQRPQTPIPNRPRLRPSDRLFWTWLSRVWPDWRSALVLVKPETVIAWRMVEYTISTSMSLAAMGWLISAAALP